MKYACLAVAVATTWPASSVSAANISVSPLNRPETARVTFEGDIVLSDDKQFQQKTSSISKAIVVMHSNGGNLHAGIAIGKIIRLRNYTTLVPDNAHCASACAIAWLGGTKRYMAANARIGFHAAFNRETGQETGVGNALIGSYLSQIGLPDRAVIYVTQASPQSMTWLTMSEAQERGIEVSLFTPPRDQSSSAEPRERHRKEDAPQRATVERPPSEPASVPRHTTPRGPEGRCFVLSGQRFCE
jgi:hypothetical protein